MTWIKWRGGGIRKTSGRERLAFDRLSLVRGEQFRVDRAAERVVGELCGDHLTVDLVRNPTDHAAASDNLAGRDAWHGVRQLNDSSGGVSG